MIACLLVLMAAGQPAPTPTPAPAAVTTPAPEHRDEAYFEFIRGRHLESEGQIDAAIEAYRRAVTLDPSSAEIPAELAALYMRQNRGEEAVRSAEAALALDPDNAEAHWVLGTVYSALVQAGGDAPSAEAAASIDRAIEHLEKARPTRRYDLGLSLALGRLYLRKQDYPKAVDLLQWLSGQGVGAAEVDLLLAQAYEGTGRRAEAIDLLRTVVADEPRFFRAWVTLGDLLEKDRRFADAAEAYGRAVAQNPRSVDLRLRQASAWLNAGQAARARTLLEAIVKDAPTEGSALFLLSDVARQLKDYDEAENVARRLVALEPKQLRGAYALALVHEARREHRKVIEVLGPAVAKADGTEAGRSLASLLVRLGAAYQALGEYDEAIAQFERARAAAGGDASFDAYLAQALTEAGRAGRALDILATLRKARPDDWRFARLEADALAAAGQVDQAVALLRDQVARRGDSLDTRLALAALCTERRQFECAAAALDEADRQFPGQLLLAFQRGALLERQQRYDEAEAAFKRALGADPLHGPTLNYLGYMLVERGQRLDEAISLIERALETDPFNPSYLDSLGWAHFQRGDTAKARRYLAQAAERLPRNSVVQDHWGDLLWRTGDRQAAIAAWERALSGDRESIDPGAISKKLDYARKRP